MKFNVTVWCDAHRSAIDAADTHRWRVITTATAGAAGLVCWVAAAVPACCARPPAGQAHRAAAGARGLGDLTHLFGETGPSAPPERRDDSCKPADPL